MPKQISRRSFVRHIGVAGATLPVVMPHLVRAVPASGKANLAAVGVGSKGWGDINSISRGQNVIGLCDVDKKKLARAGAKWPKAKTFTDFRKLLEIKEIDGLNVSTPDHMHAPVALAAMELGKHVYVQKPAAHHVGEARKMLEAATKNKIITQMGTQIHSHVYYRLAVQLVHDGAIGKVREVHTFSYKKWGDMKPRPDRKDPVPAHLDWNLWQGVAEKRPFIGKGYYHPGNWRKRLDFGTGTFGDMGCHIYDPVFGALQLTAPISLTSYGPAPNEHNWSINAKIKYVFPGTKVTTDPVTVTWYDGDAKPPKTIQDMVVEELKKGGKKAKIPNQGSIMIGEKGILLLPHVGRPELLPVEQYKDYKYPKVKGNNHYMQWTNTILGKDKTLCAFDYAVPLTEAVLLGGVATRFPNQELKWDGPGLTFTNHPKANELVQRKYHPY
ncbi:MAG: Gfo/Idh/MocA family oxidoreductase [Phycisphaeraceae bacterium]|nr:Gfo/Idh/MocA family oxidoreductase [Phycisphaeraceae bacterium]